MEARSFFFRNRSFTPIPIVLVMFYYSESYYPFWIYGALLILFGEIVRFSAVRYAGGRTRTTKVGANSLCTSGPYSRTRNPLYIGNLFIYFLQLLLGLVKLCYRKNFQQVYNLYYKL